VGGQCQSCFPGYTLLADSTCLKDALAQGCTSATATGVCANCTAQYVLGTDGSCAGRDPNCVNYTGSVCKQCKVFTYLSKGLCLKESLKEKDPNCRISDLYNYCQQCNQGYYVFEGNCTLVDQLCKTYDQSNGNCESCYDGYRVNQGKCYLNSPIFHCLTFNGIVCQQCELGFQIQSNGSCA
jgi:phagosome-associated TMK96